MKRAFITGVTGQDGSYLSELLLEKGYEVHGLVRRSSQFNRSRIVHLESNPAFKLHYGDMGDSSSLNKIVFNVQPDEVYNLAAQSHVQISFETPEYTADVDATGTVRLLEAIRQIKDNARYYQASSSEMYGKVQEVPQTETTPFYPRSPYGCSKVYSYWITKNYREGYGLHASNGILFNHESPRRGENFVTRKITRAVAEFAVGGRTEPLRLGNLDALRDWGYAKDYVEAMWLMLQKDLPDDYVIATGRMHSVREFVAAAFNRVGMNWARYVVANDPQFVRPTEVDQLCGSFSKAYLGFGWQPRTDFHELVGIMVDHDIAALTK